MYTSDTRKGLITGLKYLAAAVVVAAAGQIYELFSHGVYSNYMIFAFMIPLAAGAVPNMIAAAVNKKRGPSGFYLDASDSGRAAPGIRFAASGLQLAAVATLTVGNLVKGALEIYGTTNRLEAVYWTAGAALAAAGLAVWLRERKKP